MTQLRRWFNGVAVAPPALSAAYSAFVDERGDAPGARPVLRIDRRDESWELERIEDFVGEYERGPCRAALLDETDGSGFSFADDWGTAELTVRLATPEQIRRVMQPFEGRAAGSTFTVFVSHGRDPQWQVLVSHLRERQGIDVVTYETLASYGQPAAQVLEVAARTASAALLVHTAEVEAADGSLHAVPNVVHETGFFSAHLGPHRAIVLREDSCRPFTNIAGLTELRFADRSIREVFGDVVAVLRQERGDMRVPTDRKL